VSTRSPAAGVFPDAGARKGLSDAVRVLLAADHDAVRAEPVYPPALTVRAMATWFAAACQDADAAELDLAALQPRSRRHVALGRAALAKGLVRDADRAAWRERCQNWFADGRFDVLVTPALASAPPPAVTWSTRSWQANLVASVRYAPYAAPWNIAGFPAVVVPVGIRQDGLPVAVQLVGPPGAELSLLALAGQMEQLAPWRRHAPGWPRTGARRQRATTTPATPPLIKEV
jgi:amidase